MTTAFADLAGLDFVSEYEEHAGRYCHVVKVLPDYYRSIEHGQSVSHAGVAVNEFRVRVNSQGRTFRHVVGAFNMRADFFVREHKQVDLKL